MTMFVIEQFDYNPKANILFCYCDSDIPPQITVLGKTHQYIIFNKFESLFVQKYNSEYIKTEVWFYPTEEAFLLARELYSNIRGLR